jgi:hypothetical protein
VSGDVASVSAAGRPAARLASAVVALGATGVLGIAAWLEPSAAGHSTHLQLGLAPCTFLALTGWPCPMCGATTTFALLAHGRILEGLINQPFAALLFLGTIGIGVLAGLEAASPRGRWERLSDSTIGREGRVAAVFLGMMAGAWAWKIALIAGTIASKS